MQLQSGTRLGCKPTASRRTAVRAVASGLRAAGSAQPAGLKALAARPQAQQPLRRSQQQVCRSVANGKLISSTEVPAFIQRDDLMDQMYRWSIIEAGESGQRNFGLPMKVDPVFFEDVLWGFNVAIFKEGNKLTDIGVSFDKETVSKHEWVGRGTDGFPVLEGKAEEVKGKLFEIWKLDSNPVSEDLRSAIRAYCTGLVAALNRYYAFGSVFVDDAQ